MIPQQLAHYKQVIKNYTEKQLKKPKEQLRAEILATQKEIKNGWLGISDWLLSKGDNEKQP